MREEIASYKPIIQKQGQTVFLNELHDKFNPTPLENTDYMTDTQLECKIWSK